MPKIKISENDLTLGTTVEALSNTVYIPGGVVEKYTEKITFVTGKDAQGKDITEDRDVDFVLLEDSLQGLKPFKLTSSKEVLNVKSKTAKYKAVLYSGEVLPVDKPEIIEKPFIKIGASFELASALVGNGCYVIYEVVLPSTVNKDGFEARWAKLQDKSLFDVKFITAGEFVMDNDVYGNIAFDKMIECAEKRADCIALIDHPKVLSQTGDTYSKKVHTWAQTFNSSFAAAFTPWCSNTIHKVNNIFEVLPPSFSYLLAFSQSAKNNPNWYSAAGSFRGQIPGFIEADELYGESDIDTLGCRTEELEASGDNIGVAVNPICNIDPFGTIIWGNRTLKSNTAEGLKAGSFLNVRNLVCDIKKTLYKAARKYTFEQNTLQLWLNFCSQIEPLLSRAKTGDGILTYDLQVLETTAKARLKALVIITPIEGVEDFELGINMEDSIRTTENQ